jgi:hypothetical protein
MQIIGAGFGRTGTLSLKAALEQLGFGPCYHMIEVFKNPGHISTWQAAIDNKPVDWERILARYESAVDFPASVFYKELMAAYPHAKVILSVRDPQRWYESTSETIYKASTMPFWLPKLFPALDRLLEQGIWQRVFQGRFTDREFAIGVFNAHIEEVKRAVPKDKLLVFDVKEGWAPLCAFLQVPVPARPFPHANDRRLMKAAMGLSNALPYILVGVIGVLLFFVLRLIKLL